MRASVQVACAARLGLMLFLTGSTERKPAMQLDPGPNLLRQNTLFMYFVKITIC